MRTLLGAGLALVALQVGACSAEPTTTAPEPTAAGAPAETADGETTAGGSQTPPSTDSSSAGPGTAGSPDECEREPIRSGEDLTLQEVLDEAVAEHEGGLVVALARDGEDVRLCSAGAADTDGTPLQPNDVLRIGGITNTFTAVLLLQLVEEGEVGLDDPVSDHLPGIALVEGVSVRQLLNHSSGIPDYVDNVEIAAELLADLDRVWTSGEVLALVDGLEKEFEPGADHRYSNTNSVLAGVLVETVSGRTLADNLESRITGRLGLTDTALGPGGPDPVTGFSDFFEPDGHTEGKSYQAVESILAAAGAMVSTAPDLVVFLRALAAGELLDPATMAEMTDFRGRAGIGLGIDRVQLPIGQGYGHGGSVPGYRSFAAVTPDGTDVIVMLTNDQDLVPTPLLRRTFGSW